MAGGMCGGGGGYAWQGGMHGGMCGRRNCHCSGEGACMARGHAWQGEGVMRGGAYVTGEMPIAVGNTHSTGMDSCIFCRHVRTVTLMTMQPISDEMLTTSKTSVVVTKCQQVLTDAP